MLNATNEGGAILQVPEFVETLKAIQLPYDASASLGGVLYLVGFVMLAYNLFTTARSGKPRRRAPSRSPSTREARTRTGWAGAETFSNDPVAYITARRSSS